MSISLLIKAADYIENNKTKETDHEYALTANQHLSHVTKTNPSLSKRKRKVKKVALTKVSHNELEKKRRAYMRQCSQALREALPLKRDSTRHTLLELLVESRKHIINIDRLKKEQLLLLQELKSEQEALKFRKRQLLNKSLAYRVRLSHSVSSECSNSSVGSSWSSNNGGSISPDPVGQLKIVYDYDDEVDGEQSNSCDSMINIIDIL